MKIVIATPEKIVFEEDAYGVLVPTLEGEVGIYDNHVPYMSSLQAGVVGVKKQKTDKEWQYLAVSNGLIEFSNNELTLLVETAEREDEIDLDLANQARQRAIELRKQKDLISTQESALLTAKLEKELARIRVAEKYRKRRV
ncbi:MAG: ATP synthase F1 subunit epsilon [Pseudomonadales bacterium]|jgi:F-type H+-transporting ATPase subunit epsilon|nr:ATP synthase F1 subunit epsilon [Pseudomonadales bacterium]